MSKTRRRTGSQIRLLSVILTLEQGGAQQLLLDTLIYLKQCGVFVSVATFEDGPTHHMFEDAEIEVHLIAPKRAEAANVLAFIAEMARIYAELKRLIRDDRINVMQTHLLTVYDFLMPWLRFATPSLVGLLITFHNVKHEFEEHNASAVKRRLYNALYRLSARHVSAIVAVSDGVRHFLSESVGLSDDKVVTIPNGLPVRRYHVQGNRAAFASSLGIPADSAILATVGRLRRQKGHRYLIDAIATLSSMGHDVCLCIVGEGEERPRLQAQVQKLGIADAIRFLGHRRDIPYILASCDVFVLSSLWEGLPRAVLEAMASETTIVATDIAGTNEVLVDRVNARLVAPGEGKALADAIEEMLVQPELARSYAHRAYFDVRQNYDISRIGQQYLAIFGRVLALKSPAVPAEARTDERPR